MNDPKRVKTLQSFDELYEPAFTIVKSTVPVDGMLPLVQLLEDKLSVG